jgi:hypothetical protein
MNRNRQVIWLCAMTAICLVLATWTQGATPEGTNDPADIDRGEAQIVLKTEKAKKPAVFPHWQHQDIFECAGCHSEDSSIQWWKPIPTEWSKKTGHAFCKDCHVENKAPKKCKTCHPASKKRAYEGC